MRYKIHMKLSEAQQAFFAARRPRKDSPHTTDAYRRDLAGITALLVSELDRPADELEVSDLTGQGLRAAFGVFADGHA
ncbi:MAG TPA: integrase, partial [Amycolatopsis sp.]|nr:integrase [Amycolatopsis sp.]